MSRLIPRGVVVAGLGKRFLAALIDALPIVLVYVIAFFLFRATASSAAVGLIIIIGAAVLTAGYALYQWWAYATRGAGIGARLMGLRLVSLKDGEPIGWWRFFLRQLVFGALMGTGVGGIALLIFLVIHERRQGWHDMVGGSVMVEPKHTEAKATPQTRKPTATSTVGLPPHLASTFSPQAGTSSQWGGEQPAPAPDWLPGVQSEPLQPQQAHQQQWQAQQPQQQPMGQPSASQAPWQPPSGGGWSPAPQQNPQQPQAGQQWGQPQQQPAEWQPAPQSSAPNAPLPQQWSAPEPEQEPLVSPTRPQQNWIPIPSASSVIEPSRKVRVRPRDFGEVDDDEGTRIAKLPPAGQREGDEGWYVRLDDGREVELSVIVLLGRNPHKSPEDPEEVHLVPASGDGRMISRTHVMIGTDPRGVYVVDRGSTNGTALVASGGELEPCPPGTQVRVREGQQVSYGNRWFTVLRRPAI